MKIADALRALFKRNTISKEEIQAAIDRSLEYLHQIRPPESLEAKNKYLSFLGQYAIEHPDTAAKEAHDACMETHPEYWPKTLPQKYQPVYSH